MRVHPTVVAAAGAFICAAALANGGRVRAASPDDGQQLLTIDHYVQVRSTVPAIAGQTAQIYVRERVRAGAALRGPVAPGRVVLFIHGAGTPAEVAFDPPHEDYSWMGYLAAAGFDAFAMDTTGYGRSTRPPAMHDPCNLAPAQQTQFIPQLLKAPCQPPSPHQLTTIASDWDDIGAVVDHIRALRRVDKVNLIAWSLGGPRSGGYAALHPEKVERMVVLAPAYNAASAASAPAVVPGPGVPFNVQSRADFDANWDRQVGCAAQYEKGTSDSVWAEMLASDPVGATWGSGVRRAPVTQTWGWNAGVVAKTRTPMLIVAGVHDKQVPIDRVRQLYTDLGSPAKVFVDLACSSHNAMWERNHRLLFRASAEWLTAGTVNGTAAGELRLGYDE